MKTTASIWPAPDHPAAPAKQRLRLRVNGEQHDLLAPLNKTLLEVLREDLGLTGTKHGCELGECGTCTVLVDGEPLLSCLVLPVEIEGTAIETVEGLAGGADPHPLQVAFAETGAAQCGYCTPGILMAAKALLDGEKRPDRETIKQHLAGNLCRCTGYLQILQAVELAGARLAERAVESDLQGAPTKLTTARNIVASSRAGGRDEEHPIEGPQAGGGPR